MMVGACLCGSSLPAHAQQNPMRDVFFGETHIHTSWSFDAFVFGQCTPVPRRRISSRSASRSSTPVATWSRLKRPLDFEAVTDHAEYMGTVPARQRPAVGPEQAADRRTVKGQKPGRHPEGLPLPRQRPCSRTSRSRSWSPRKWPEPYGSVSPTSQTSTTSRASSRRSPHTNGPRRRTIATFTATSSSRTPRRFRRCRLRRSTRQVRRTCGPGWTHNARPGTTYWRSRTTPIFPTA